MILNMIRMQACPNKRLELSQALLFLGKDVRKMKGCISHHSYQDLDSENTFSLMQTWNTQEDLEAFLNSPLFQVLKGATELLSESNIFQFNVVYQLDSQTMVQKS